MNKKWMIVACVVLSLLLVVTVGALIYNSANVSCRGRVKTVGVSVFEDEALSIPLIEIDWGLIEPNETKQFVFYALNDGNAPIDLTMTTDNFNPSNASDYLTLTWDYVGQTILPDEYLELTFELYVAYNISGIEDFSFDITVFGEA